MTKGSLIEYQALKIAQLEQDVKRLRSRPEETSYGCGFDWRLIDADTPRGEYLLVSCGLPLVNPVCTAIVIAKQVEGKWEPMFTTGAYQGAKYWKPLDSAPPANDSSEFRRGFYDPLLSTLSRSRYLKETAA